MGLYTKAGDEGFTTRPGGQRVRKYDPRVDAIGVVDELSAHIGWCIQAAPADRHAAIREALEPIRAELLAIGALLASAGTESPPGADLEASAVTRMEGQIDRVMGQLPELTHFVLPGGCELGCRLHLGRTVCRRAERAVTAAAAVETRIPKSIFKYLNRLSDLLFALARLANHREDVEEQTWQGPKPR